MLNLWRGSTPTVVRAMVVNMAHLATYDEAKDRICKATGRARGDFGVQLAASSSSGLAIVVTSLPVDTVKTRMMNMRPLPDGRHVQSYSDDGWHLLLGSARGGGGHAGGAKPDAKPDAKPVFDVVECGERLVRAFAVPCGGSLD